MDTARLTGRQVVADDLRFVDGLWNDERVSPNLGGTCSEQQSRERIERWTRHWNDHGFGPTLFHERTTGHPIGWGGLQYASIGGEERLTVGYVIAPAVWGRGYASEIASASVTHAFDELGAGQLFAEVLSTNAASRRVLEKAGLTVHSEIGHGNEVDVIYLIER